MEEVGMVVVATAVEVVVTEAAAMGAEATEEEATEVAA